MPFAVRRAAVTDSLITIPFTPHTRVTRKCARDQVKLSLPFQNRRGADSDAAVAVCAAGTLNCDDGEPAFHHLLVGPNFGVRGARSANYCAPSQRAAQNTAGAPRCTLVQPGMFPAKIVAPGSTCTRHQ